MATTSKPLRSTGGGNRRQREPLTDEQLKRAREFLRRVFAGTSKIHAGQPDSPPVMHASGPQLYGTATFTDRDLEYTVTIWATRRRDPHQPDVLP